jgi:hypothetical protein
VRIAFTPRNEILEPAAVAGAGPVALALARRLMAHGSVERFTGVAAASLVIAIGDDLPWVDGVTYLGRDPQAPLLLLPTQLEPSARIDLVERALSMRAKGVSPPLAILASPPRIVSLAAALPIDRARLAAWIEAHR